MNFNPNPSTIMHIDVNSCFATIEQQANPNLRGKPVVVAAYATGNGCILAPSVEAKRFGIKTGMRVKDAKPLCPALIVLPPDPDKYRDVHLKLRKLLTNYTDKVYPRSIDEFVLNLKGYPTARCGMWEVGREIKQKVKAEIGEWITVSIGIAPNRYLAKVAAGVKKPDGLVEVNKNNFLDLYSNLKLTDLTGIKERNAARLASMEVFSVLDFYNAPVWKLKAAFHSIAGYYWYLRLHGYEIDDVPFARRSYGNSYVLPKPLASTHELSPILSKLVEKTGFRLRRAGYCAQGVHLSIVFNDGSLWHHGAKTPKVLFDSKDFFKEATKILISCPHKKPVRNLAVSVFNLVKSREDQLGLFEDVIRKKNLVNSLDRINKRWGDFVISPARMLGTSEFVKDRIAFGGVKELEEISLHEIPHLEVL